ncbi:MAG TPA: PilZ domain-containing protein [Solirubrobacteraceae bacterium]
MATKPDGKAARSGAVAGGAAPAGSAATAGERGIAIVAEGLPTDDLQLAQLPHPATLVTPLGERIPGRITRCSGPELQVLLLYTLPRSLSDEQLGQIVLEVGDGQHKTRLGGTTAWLDGETLSFKEMHVVQRREYVRVDASLSVEVRLAGTSEPLDCRSIDLSGGGMLLRGIEHLHVGERLGFSIKLKESAPDVVGKATIVRCDEGGARALCFDSISDTDQQRLIRFLFERQREARRKGLLI